MSKPRYLSSLLLFALLLSLSFRGILAQEIDNESSVSGKTQSNLSFSQAASPNDSYDPTIRSVQRTSAGSGPSGHIDKIIEPFLLWADDCHPADISDSGYGSLAMYRKAGKGYRGTVKLFGGIKTHCGYSAFSNIGIIERIFRESTNSQVKRMIANTINEKEKLRDDVFLEFSSPAVDWDVNSRNTWVSFLQFWPTIQNMICGYESPGCVNEESSARDVNDLVVLILVGVSADHRDNRVLDGRYCFDGNSFVLSPTVNGKQQQCDESKVPHGDAPVISVIRQTIP